MRVTMSKEIYNYLANHMMYIHHEKLNMIKGYSLDYDSYMGMLGFLNGYIKMVEHLLDNAILVEGETEPPIMIIGGTAVISRNGVETECGIILPNGGHLSRRRPGAMVLAAGKPEANPLLFKTVGEEVLLEAFGQNGRIERIIYDPIFKSEQYAFDSEQYAV